MQEPVSSAAALEQATADSGTYRLLARLWLREVDSALLRELRKPPLCDAFEQAGGELPEGDSKTMIDTLAIDYCQLFLGPTDHLPPFQSVWQNGQFQGPSTALMKQFIDATSYQPPDLAQTVMVDHLGIQLDLMGHLLDQSTLLPSDSQQRYPWLRLMRTFFGTHLMWPDDLLASASERATSQFYRSTIRLTRDFLHCQKQTWTGSVANG